MARRHLTLVAAGLALLLLAVYREVVFGGKTFVERDHLVYTLPIRTVLHEAAREGRFPQWWDAIGLGTPFAANPVHQAFSPVAWTCSALPMPLGADVEPVVLLFIAGLGTALLAGRFGAGALGAFVAGALVATSGYFGSMTVNGNLPYMVWVPWLAWAADRLAAAGRGGGSRTRDAVRAAAVVAVLVALQLTGAEPGATLTAAVVVLAIVLLRSDDPLPKVGWLAAASVAGVALGAVTLLPALLLSASSKRGGGVPWEIAAGWSLHPLRLLEWVWPRVLGDPIGVSRSLAVVAADAGGETLSEPSWSFSVFLGAPAILLAIAGAADRRRRWLLALSVPFVVIALGRFTPAFAALRTIFPPERYMRYPEKHVLGAIVLVSAFAGVGLTRLGREAPRWIQGAFTAGTAILAALVLGVAVLAPRIAAWAQVEARGTGLALDAASALGVSIRAGALAAGALALASAAIALTRTPRWQYLALAIVALATVAVPAIEAGAILSLAPREEVRGPPATLRVAEAAAPGERRIFRDRIVPPLALGPEAYARWVNETLAGDSAARFGYQVLPGMNPAESAEYAEFFSGRQGVLSPSALASLLGIRFAMFDARAGVPLPGPEVARAHRVVLSVAPRVRPRAFVPAGVAYVPSAEEGVRALATAERRDPGVVVVEGAGEPLPAAAGTAVPCAVESDRPEHVDLVCAAARPSYAVLLDGFAPGWSATVDGADAPIVRADGLFRAVRIEPGAHRIAFRYETPGLRVGAIVSVAAALAISVAVWFTRRKARDPSC